MRKGEREGWSGPNTSLMHKKLAWLASREILILARALPRKVTSRATTISKRTRWMTPSTTLSMASLVKSTTMCRMVVMMRYLILIQKERIVSA